MIRKSLFLALVLVPAGCGGGVPAIDLDAAREGIRSADVEFCEALTEGDAGRFRSFIAADAAFFGQGVYRGPDEVMERWAPLLGPDAPRRLTWEPEEIRVSSSGDLGFSIGRYEMSASAESGEEQKSYGRYVTIWAREPDGSWKAVVDIGTPPGPDPL